MLQNCKFSGTQVTMVSGICKWQIIAMDGLGDPTYMYLNGVGGAQ